jgi:hypothetical protein
MSAGNFATAFQPGWLEFDIQVETSTGDYDNHGDPLYSAPVTMKCYIEEKVTLVRSATGEEGVSNTKLYVCGGPLDEHDRITMPPSFRGPSVQKILAVSNVNDRLEFSHSEVYL